MKTYFGAACLLVLLGCAHGSGTTRSQKVSEQQLAWARVCEGEPGAPVHINYEDASGGAAVLFTTQGDPSPLQEHAEQVARLHNRGARELSGNDLSEVRLPHTAEVEQLQNGAKLTLLPRRPTDLDGLRRHVQQDITWMKRHGCTTSTEVL